MRNRNQSPERYYADDFDRPRRDSGDERDDAHQYRREHYTRQSGRWGAEEPPYGRRYGERPQEQAGTGRPNRRGPQYEQGGQYPGTRATGPFEGLRSRSADPGQSSYGGFRDEDPRWQRQQLDYGDEPSYGEFEGQSHDWNYGERRGDPYGWQGQPRSKSQRITPKGYVRSDERVREDLCERLSHSGLDVSDVSVDVSDGVVALEGTVPDRRTKHAIEDCADDCLGVTDIQNRIRVASGNHPGMTRME
ncbi:MULTISPECIES: BON domain-containing protein [Bordetella]|uniref:BON domain-containing protein n=2 Tax=Bordetella TaxID=517 RepID=A0A261VNQ7_9BORD|nr:MULTISPECIES: BON domain-containing protein [Bordetella]MDM9557684.1 BON domain-containing protein [Bordetella petrii]OZI75768.1 BON domain-containing protein [Bordetella genomosp. 2]